MHLKIPNPTKACGNVSDPAKITVEYVGLALLGLSESSRSGRHDNVTSSGVMCDLSCSLCYKPQSVKRRGFKPPLPNLGGFPLFSFHMYITQEKIAKHQISQFFFPHTK